MEYSKCNFFNGFSHSALASDVYICPMLPNNKVIEDAT